MCATACEGCLSVINNVLVDRNGLANTVGTNKKKKKKAKVANAFAMCSMRFFECVVGVCSVNVIIVFADPLQPTHASLIVHPRGSGETPMLSTR